VYVKHLWIFSSSNSFVVQSSEYKQLLEECHKKKDNISQNQLQIQNEIAQLENRIRVEEDHAKVETEKRNSLENETQQFSNVIQEKSEALERLQSELKALIEATEKQHVDQIKLQLV
jgi:chromosome segregation ATPase